MDRDLIGDEFAEDFGEPISSYLNRTITAVAAYEAWDRCLISDMLSDEGNAFAQAYFDFENGQYLADYGELLKPELANGSQFLQGLYCESCSIGYLPEALAKPSAPRYQLEAGGWRRILPDGTLGPLLQRISDDPAL